MSMSAANFYSKGQQSAQTNKPLLLSEAFSDIHFYKHRSQSNSDQYTPPIKGFQIIKLKGPTRQIAQSVKSQKSIKTMKKRNSQPQLHIPDIKEYVIQQDDNEMHQKLLNLFEIDLQMKKELDINRMLVQDRKQEGEFEEVKNDIYLMLTNTISRIHQYINANNLERSNLKKAHRRTALEIQNQIQDFVNMVLTAISKRDLVLSKLIENLWKLICVSIEMIQQNAKAEQNFIQTEVLSDLKSEVIQLKQENQEIYSKYTQVNEQIKKLNIQHRQEINNLNYQLNILKAEFYEYKQSQESMNNLENATDSLKDVEGNLKDTTALLNKIEETITKQDQQYFSSLKAVVQQHKMDQEDQMNKIQKINKKYCLKSLTQKQEQIASGYFNHSFTKFLTLKLDNKNIDQKLIENILISWFNNECLKPQFGVHPAQQRLESICNQEKKSTIDSFINFLLITNNIELLQPIVEIICQQINKNDLNTLNKQDKNQRYFYLFFGIILQFDINNISIDLLTYDRIRYFYSGLQQSGLEEEQKQMNSNKLQWYNFICSNLIELCESIFPDYKDKINNQQQIIAQIFVNIIQGEYDKHKQLSRNLIENNKNIEMEINSQQQKVQQYVIELCNYFNYQYNEQQMMLYAQLLFDRYIRVNQNGKKQQCLDLQQWTTFITELFQLIQIMIDLNPFLYYQINITEDLTYINKEFQVISQRNSQIERRESTIKKK